MTVIYGHSIMFDNNKRTKKKRDPFFFRRKTLYLFRILTQYKPSTEGQVEDNENEPVLMD